MSLAPRTIALSLLLALVGMPAAGAEGTAAGSLFPAGPPRPEDPAWPKLRAWAAGAELDGEPQGPPPGTVEQRLARAREIVGPACVRCHGFDARGGGAGGVGMEPPPANLVDRPVRFRTTEAEAKPTELDLFRTITRGIRGTGMPPFADLPEADRWALATWARSLQPGVEGEPLAIPGVPSDLDTPARIARGEQRFRSAGCSLCHTGQVGPVLEERQPRRSRAPAEIYATIHLGLPGTAMPPHALGEEALWDLVAYVRSRLPVPGSGWSHPQEREGMLQLLQSCADD